MSLADSFAIISCHAKDVNTFLEINFAIIIVALWLIFYVGFVIISVGI